jgi:hypothetical protein
MLVEGAGFALAVAVAGANRNDMKSDGWSLMADSYLCDEA